MSRVIQSTLLFEHYEIFHVYSISQQVQQEVASSQFPEGRGKKKNKLSHSFRCNVDRRCDFDPKVSQIAD